MASSSVHYGVVTCFKVFSSHKWDSNQVLCQTHLCPERACIMNSYFYHYPDAIFQMLKDDGEVLDMTLEDAAELKDMTQLLDLIRRRVGSHSEWRAIMSLKKNSKVLPKTTLQIDNGVLIFAHNDYFNDRLWVGHYTCGRTQE